jgi:hypothetical protein
MELTSEEVDKHLNIIFTGSETVSFYDKIFVFKYPSNELIAKSNIIYSRALKRAIDSGLMCVSDWEKLIESRNIFSKQDRDKLDELTTRKKAQEVILSKTSKVKANRDRLKGIIAGLDDEIRELRFKYTSKLSMSAESKAEEERALYLCWACVYDDAGNRYWNRFDDLLAERNIPLKDEVLLGFLKFKAGISTDIIRYLARHSLWRIRYVTSQKVSDPLFGVPTSQYTNDMLNLAYWSNFYQGIYEMMPKDRPPDSIIEDDAALDAYMNEYYKERSREDAEEREKNKLGNKGKLSAFNKQEVIVTQSHELYEDIEYTKPREAQMVKDKTSISKRSKRRKR